MLGYMQNAVASLRGVLSERVQHGRMFTDLSDTIAFVCVVKHGSFTAAASLLGVPKGRLSRKVKELELRLGVQLLKRSTRSLGLTDAGRIFYESSAAGLEAIEHAERSVGDMHLQLKGLVKITCPHWFAADLLGPILADFSLQHLDIMLQLVTGHDVADLIRNDFDLALRIWTSSMPDSTALVRHVATLRTGLFASPAYLEEFGVPEEPADLVQHRTLASHVLTPGQYVWRMSNGSDFVESLIKPVMIASDPGALRHPLQIGAGLMMAPLLLVNQDLNSGRLVRVMAEWAGDDAHLFLVRPASRSTPKRVTQTADYLVSRIREVVARAQGDT
jgi:DNA-binding transcriptional LysR family regulator